METDKKRVLKAALKAEPFTAPEKSPVGKQRKKEAQAAGPDQT